MPERRELTELEQRHKKIAVRLAIFFACLILIDLLIISLFYTFSDWLVILIFSLLFIVPGYISNASMVITGGGKPIDNGKNWRDGRRIFGDHKTWNGLIKGPLYVGIPVTFGIFIIFIATWPIIQLVIQQAMTEGAYKLYTDVNYYQFIFIGANGPFLVAMFMLFLRIVLCAYGAAFGDLVGSFLKRRFDIKSGAPFFIVDQLDFAVFAIFFASIPAIFFPGVYLAPDLNIIIFLLILTPSVSIIANTVAYMIGLKEVPW